MYVLALAHVRLYSGWSKEYLSPKKILTHRFCMLNIFISLEGHIPPQHDIPYVKWDINKEW